MNTSLRLRAFLTPLFIAAGLPLAAQTTTPATPGAARETIELSPFIVDASTEKGYQATQTLSGTRLKTDLKDVGAALTIFTEQLLDDLGASNLNDVLNFAPNTDNFVNTLSDTTGNGNNFINVATQYVTRGGATSVVGQDFFANDVPGDRFNSEAYTFSRGPNAILFGLGNPAGSFGSSTKRARHKTATTVELRTDDRESLRTMIDHNQVIKPGLLAVRYTGLYDKAKGFRIPSESLQRRHFATLNFTPFKKTTIRANYEQGQLIMPATRPWPVYDSITPWFNAGSPAYDVFPRVAAKPANSGISNYTGTNLVSTEFSLGGTPISTLQWTNQGQTAGASFANGLPVSGNKRSFINPAVYPTFASTHGTVSFRKTDYKIHSFFLEQQLTRDLFIEAAYNRVANDVVAVNGFNGSGDFLFADMNRYLPTATQTPNPNYGRLYTESAATAIVAPNLSVSKRLMVSYELDLTRRTSPWLRYLGRHRAVAFGEEVDRSGYSTNNQAFNATPLATTGAAASINNGANLINFRYYYDPASGQVGNHGGQFDRFPVIYANTPLPERRSDGVTPAFFNFQGPNLSSSNVKTRALAVQSLFWHDRIVLTNGWRNDSQRAWRAIPNDFLALRDSRNVFPDPNGYDVRTFAPASLRERDGGTVTHGVVFHARPWLSFTYNTSNNFQVNDSTRDVYGELLPNPQGEGKDYGVKLNLLGRRLFLDVSYYTNAGKNKIDSVANTPAGDFKSNLDEMWIGIANLTNDNKYRFAPYNNQGTLWSDAVTGSSSGWEASVTANPTEQWRFTLNGSKRSTSKTSQRGLTVLRYLSEYLPIVKGNAAWLAANTATNLSVRTRVDNLEAAARNLVATGALPEDIYAPSWSLNMIQSYSFGHTSRLKGVALGGTMNVRGRSIDGFATDAANVLIADRPYYAPRYEIFGAWLAYGRKILNDRFHWRIQLNVRNVFDAYTVFPLRAVDSRDGKNTPANAIYRLSEPRTWQLTSTLRF